MNEIHYAGFWLRFVAFLIDSIVVSILLAPLALFLDEVPVQDYNLQDPVQALALIHELSLRWSFDVVLAGTIVVLFWVFRSATPGKMVFKARIANAGDGGKPSTGRLIIRYLGYFVSLLPFGLGFLWIAFDARKQGWHDKMADTVVIRGERGGNEGSDNE
ncbi:MAG: RDD family protein [Pseudomonadales bacterium]|nr:RDD family protein [Pseudomonadales bacterium]